MSTRSTHLGVQQLAPGGVFNFLMIDHKGNQNGN
jgi:hypothetical protein